VRRPVARRDDLLRRGGTLQPTSWNGGGRARALRTACALKAKNGGGAWRRARQAADDRRWRRGDNGVPVYYGGLALCLLV